MTKTKKKRQKKKNEEIRVSIFNICGEKEQIREYSIDHTIECVRKERM